MSQRSKSAVPCGRVSPRKVCRIIGCVGLGAMPKPGNTIRFNSKCALLRLVNLSNHSGLEFCLSKMQVAAWRYHERSLGTRYGGSIKLSMRRLKFSQSLFNLKPDFLFVGNSVFQLSLSGPLMVKQVVGLARRDSRIWICKILCNLSDITVVCHQWPERITEAAFFHGMLICNVEDHGSHFWVLSWSEGWSCTHSSIHPPTDRLSCLSVDLLYPLLICWLVCWSESSFFSSCFGEALLPATDRTHPLLPFFCR